MDASSDDDGTTIPREQDAPRALILAMIAAMLLSVAGALLWIQRAGVAESVIGRPAPLGAHGPIFTVAEIVRESAPGNLISRDVALWGVPVREVTGDLLFWVGTDAAPDSLVPVLLLGEQTDRQAERETVVRAGDIVAVFGSVRPIRDAALSSREMDDYERVRLGRARVYISALRVESLRPAPPP